MSAPQPPHKGAFVNELRVGERVVGFFLVRSKQLEPFRDRSKGNFLSLMLADRTGQILARAWEGAPELAEAVAEGDVVKVAGDVEEYLGRTQLIITRLRAAQPDEYDLADYQPATSRDRAALWADVDGWVARLQTPALAALVRHFYADPQFRERLTEAPASRRVHHAYLGGLLEHLAEVLKLCETVLALYPEINADLLITGALLHDLGTLQEYAWEADITHTDAGRLVGHIVIGAELAAAAIAQQPDFPDELRLRVLHMLVSHHGRYEWGSPRRPQTLEAIALHHVEDLSVQLNRFSQLLQTQRAPGRAWTQYDRLLGRQLYAGPDADPDAGDLLD